MPAVECCVQLIHSILCTVLWTKYLVTQAVPARYQTLVAQAEIELAFHSPETVGSWHARWSDRVAEHDLETLFWQWGERFPSLAGMERWQWQDMPFWQVIAEAGMAARVVGHAVREMERWMVPNKLREAA